MPFNAGYGMLIHTKSRRTEKIESIFGNLYDESSHLTDEEWEKLHLLLAKYKKEERLKEINVQDEQNDGEITEK